MGTQAYLPLSNDETKLIKKGDIIELITGEKATFIEMKRTNWIGKMDGKTYNIPVWRDKSQRTPYAKEVVGKDESVIIKSFDPLKLNPGQLFTTENSKETFMFKGIENGRGKTKVKGIDIGSGNNWKFNLNCTFIPVNVSKMKKELLNG